MTLAAAFGNQVQPLEFTEAVIREAGAYPGVEAVALTSSFPLDQALPFSNSFTIPGEVGCGQRSSGADRHTLCEPRILRDGRAGVVTWTDFRRVRPRSRYAGRRGRQPDPRSSVFREHPLGRQIQAGFGGLAGRSIEIVGVSERRSPTAQWRRAPRDLFQQTATTFGVQPTARSYRW